MTGPSSARAQAAGHPAARSGAWQTAGAWRTPQPLRAPAPLGRAGVRRGVRWV